MWLIIVYNVLMFLSGVAGIFLTRRNLLIVLICIEMILLASNLNFIFFSLIVDDWMGDIMSLYILGVAAAESSIALAIVLVYYRVQSTVELSVINMLKG